MLCDVEQLELHSTTSIWVRDTFDLGNVRITGYGGLLQVPKPYNVYFSETETRYKKDSCVENTVDPSPESWREGAGVRIPHTPPMDLTFLASIVLDILMLKFIAKKLQMSWIRQ